AGGLGRDGATRGFIDAVEAGAVDAAGAGGTAAGHRTVARRGEGKRDRRERGGGEQGAECNPGVRGHVYPPWAGLVAKADPAGTAGCEIDVSRFRNDFAPR